VTPHTAVPESADVQALRVPQAGADGPGE